MLPCRKISREKDNNCTEVLWQACIRQLFEVLIIDLGVSVSNFWLVILQEQRRITERADFRDGAFGGI